MDINNDLQQINTFVKGMNTDVSDALMDSSQYRYAENVRLATNTEENTGELRLIEGNKICSDLSNFGNIIAMTSVRNLLIVVTANGVDNYIVVKDTAAIQDKDKKWRVVYYSNTKEDQLGDHPSLVTRWESDNNVKLYIADGIHPLMYINLMAKEGEEYVVKSGVDSISNTVDAFLKQPTGTIINAGGHMNAPKVQYAYRMYKMGGAATNLSPLSSIIVLYKTINSGYETATENVYKIDKQVKVTIPENETDCEYIQIFRVGYVSGDGEPDVQMIYDDLYSSLAADHSYTDSGYNIESVDYNEFLSYIKFNTVPRIIESKNNYLFSANVQDTQAKVDSMYETVDISDCITIDESCIETTDVYIGVDNKKYHQLGSAVTEQFRSLRPGEVYRYGVVLYDSNGNYTSAKWLCDLPVTGEYNVTTEVYQGQTYYKFKRIGVRPIINWNLLLSEDKCPNCVAVEIVRCIRTASDRYTITQGIAGYPLNIYDKESGQENPTQKGAVCSPGILSTNRFVVTGNMKFFSEEYNEGEKQQQFGVSDNNYLLFASPEYVYQKDDIQNVLESGQIYIQHDGEVVTNTTIGQGDRRFDEGDIDARKNARRIQAYETAFDYGVPYTVQQAPEDINLLYTWLYANFFDGDLDGSSKVIVNAPTYDYTLQGVPNITTFIHTAWHAAHYAHEGWQHAATTGYRPYISGVNKGFPKVYFEASVYNTIYNQTQQCNIDGNIGYATVPAYDSLFDNQTFMGSSFISPGPINYVNWTIPVAYQNDTNSPTLFDNSEGYINLEYSPIDEYYAFQGQLGQFTYPMGSTGECIILKQSDPTPFYDGGDEIHARIVSLKQNTNPYGGSQTKKMSTYVSFGNVILANNNPDVIYDGDCFPGAFVYNASHAYYGPCGGVVTQGNVQIVPLYSDVDLSATFGDLFPNLTQANKYWLQDKAGQIGNYKQDKDAYMYNTAYGLDPTAMKYNTIEYVSIDSDMFDTRVFYSDPKTNNEHIDSWLNIKPLNYKDVDSRFGQITNMRLFKDHLLFWQEHATGILSVNERTMLNDTNGNEIIVGTGDVLSRYDYISTVYGMKEFQYEAEVQSNSTQYWWDGYNKEILAYGGGMELVPLTKIKGVTNYINQREESSHPALLYDTKYDEIIAHVVGDNSLVYNEQIQSFSSIYTFMPLYRANIGNDLYASDTQKIYIQDKQDLGNYSKLFNKPTFPKVRVVVNKNNIYTKTFDNLTFGGRMYKGSLPTIVNWPIQRGNGEYIKEEHLNAPMHHLIFTFETPLKQKSAVRGDKAASVDEYDYRLAIPRNGSDVEYGNRMRGKTMQCEIASDYNSTDFSLQYITTKFRMSWS